MFSYFTIVWWEEPVRSLQTKKLQKYTLTRWQLPTAQSQQQTQQNNIHGNCSSVFDVNFK